MFVDSFSSARVTSSFTHSCPVASPGSASPWLCNRLKKQKENSGGLSAGRLRKFQAGDSCVRPLCLPGSSLWSFLGNLPRPLSGGELTCQQGSQRLYRLSEDCWCRPPSLTAGWWTRGVPEWSKQQRWCLSSTSWATMNVNLPTQRFFLFFAWRCCFLGWGCSATPALWF